MTTFSSHGNSESQSAQPWLRETVQAFFEAVTWDGRLATAAPALGDLDRAESTMTMTVNDFFQTIAWEGQPLIGVPITPLAAAPTSNDVDLDLTLDGFSDLFG
ncbi:hypothetical protein IQ254_02485 [Nodosilinea sp. LEGE 07088]|uniref:hypothetical protein n=1 Tax=Nodosilinea sp. LEGE 07088 TaxID=2777968 RepID=UPI00187E58AD|nr:hypothetical protein [Nodosilinea sp. LEGE 07088]MBE9136079.1 hypothetical protein [Nodosilinea sp. LEGE 07088]